MASASMSSRRTGRGETPALGTQGRRFAARRMLLVIGLLVLLTVIAVGANYGPLTHYLQARERFDQTTAEVNEVKERITGLQAQLGKLSQSGHLEDLARQQLTYALPGEELYIVTGGAAAEAGAATGETATREAGETVGVAEAASTPDQPGPGFFERILTKIASLF